VEGMKASATKTASGMKATAAVETAAPAAAMTRLGHVCEREPHHCARHDPSKRQNPFVPSSQHLFLHLN
jgi:hypothetical protein